MKSMGLFTPTEWNLLVRNAWTNDPKMQERVRRGWAHQDLTEEQLQEEAVAEYFGEHVSMLQGADPDAPPQLAVRILRRIMNVIAAVLKAYRKVVGQPTGSIEAYQLAEKMRTGKIGARPEGFGEAARDRAARGPATVTFGKKGEGPRFQAAPGPLGINDSAEPRLVAPIRALLGADTADKLGDAIDHFRYALQDRMLPVLRTQAKIERMLGRKLEDNENPYLAEELFHGRTGAGSTADQRICRAALRGDAQQERHSRGAGNLPLRPPCQGAERPHPVDQPRVHRGRLGHDRRGGRRDPRRRRRQPQGRRRQGAGKARRQDARLRGQTRVDSGLLSAPTKRPHGRAPISTMSRCVAVLATSTAKGRRRGSTASPASA
jgi:hypothetical protein